jgi:hypothetical protein
MRVSSWKKIEIVDKVYSLMAGCLSELAVVLVGAELQAVFEAFCSAQFTAFAFWLLVYYRLTVYHICRSKASI